MAVNSKETLESGILKYEEDFYERCRAGAIIGTLQAGFTNLEYLGKTTNAIFEREALLGVSLTGIMEKHALVLTEKVLKKGAKIAVDTNKEIAEMEGKVRGEGGATQSAGTINNNTMVFSGNGAFDRIGELNMNQPLDAPS